MKNLESLLQQLQQNNVKLRVEDDKIKFQDPEKFIKGEVLELIKKHKFEIISLLNTNNSFSRINGSFILGNEIPISKIQKPLLFAELISETEVSHNLSISYLFNKEITVTKLKTALTDLVDKNDGLRLGYIQESGDWKAKLNSSIDLLIEHACITEADINKQYGSLSGYTREYVRRKFVFDGSPLIRIQLCELENRDVLLNISIHHSICDGLSLASLSNKLHVALFTPNKVNELYSYSASYLDYLCWQEKIGHNEGVNYWRTKLDGAPSHIKLPTDFTRPSSVVFDASSSFLQLENVLIEKLTQVSKKYKVSQFTILLAGFYCLLSRYSTQEDIVIGVPFSNRDQPEITNTIGLFINTLPIRVKLTKDLSFEQLLGQVFESVQEATQYQQTPLLDIIEAVNPSRSASHSPLFQVLVNYLDIQGGTRDLFGAHKKDISFDDKKEKQTKYDLTLNITNKNNEFNVVFEYSNNLFKQETIQRMQQHYVQLLAHLLSSPSKPVNSHDILVKDELSFLSALNANNKELPEIENPYNCIEKISKLTPNKRAITYKEEILTFAHLDAKINEISEQLISARVKKGDRVGLSFIRSPQMICAIYACFKLGAVYVPIDPAYPVNRVKYIVKDADISCVLTTSSIKSILTKINLNVPAIFVDELNNQSSVALPTEKIQENDSAYIIHTSGTTGNPKGVNVSHGNLQNLLSGLDDTFTSNGIQTWLAQTSINFDISIVELIWTLTRGHNVVLQQSKHVDIVNLETENTRRPLEFSIMFFSEDNQDEDKYELMLNSATYADKRGFKAVWLPERHFGEFGGAFANPAIACAALSTVTKNINLRAGSVVLPLHDPIRVAEEWSMIDNLSNGRVGLAIASGWHPNDFVFEGANFEKRHSELRSKLSELQNLWQGKAITRKNGLGNIQKVITRPAPKQKLLPTWITAAGNPDTFKFAGKIGANILTHMLGQTIEQLESNIKLYHQTLTENGFSIEDKEITLMLHTYLDQSEELALAETQAPFKKYIKSSLNLIAPIAEEMGIELEENKAHLIDIAFDRLSKTSTLFGTQESCQSLLNSLHQIGITEIASLIDFGLDTKKTLKSLELIASAKDIYRDDWKLAKYLSQVSYKSELDLIHQHEVSHVQMTPSQLKVLLKQHELTPVELPVKKWLIGGEKLSQELVEQLKLVSTGRCYNMYGPTETTIWSAWLDVTDTNVFIGKPTVNTHFYLLDKNGLPSPIGVVGELHIGGKGVTKGYWNKVELTQKSFKHIYIPDLYDDRLYKTGDLMKMTSSGLMHYIGRADDQIKINGYRIELNEIEYNLQNIVGIKDCRVAVKTGANEERYLAAYVVKSGIVAGKWVKSESVKVAKAFTFADGSLVYHQSDLQLGGNYKDIFDDKVYLRHGIELEENDLIFDVGANVGSFSMFVQKCQPTAEIIAFEPVPEVFALLKKNFEHRNINGLIYNCGISNKEETAKFIYYKKMSGLSGRFSDVESEKQFAKSSIQSEQSILKEQLGEDLDSYLEDIYQSQDIDCNMNTLSSVIKDKAITRIDLLKLDTEKSECLALQGIEHSDWNKIKQIVVKVTGNKNLSFVKSLLKEKGFDMRIDDFIKAEYSNCVHRHIYLLYGKNTRFSCEKAHDSVLFTNPSKVDIRNQLLESLPDFMIPSEIHFVGEIPLLKNGKADFSTLKKLEPVTSEVQSNNFATHENEIRIANVWNRILGKASCPIDVSFFELGGTSLNMVNLHSELQKELGVDIKIVDLFRYKTIKEQSDFVKLKLKASISSQGKKNVIPRTRRAIAGRRKKSTLVD